MEMNKEFLDYLLTMGELRPEQEEALRMQKQAEMLRGQSMQSPQMRTAGRVSVAPNPLEVLGQVGMAYGAKRKGDEAEQRQRDYQSKQLKAIGAMRDRMWGGAPAAGGYEAQYGWEG